MVYSNFFSVRTIITNISQKLLMDNKHKNYSSLSNLKGANLFLKMHQNTFVV